MPSFRFQWSVPHGNTTSNQTNTSFTTHAVVVQQQSIDQNELPTSAVAARQISHLASQNNIKRLEGLAYLKTLLGPDSRLSDAVQTGQWLPNVLQLTLVTSQEVREQAVEIIRRIPGRERRDYVEQMLPFVRAGLTHLAANVASTSLDLLQWLVDYCGEELVSCRGGWVKTLKCFLVMLRWTSETRRSGWTFSKSSMGDQTYQAGSLVKCIEVLESFLRAGLSRPREDRVPMSNFPRFPLAGTLGAHIPTNTAGGYSCLDLFGETLDDENAECHDVETRKRILAENFQPALEQGLAALLADGGHIGLAAKEAAEVLQKGMGNALGHDGYGSNEELGDIPEDEEPRAEGSQGGDAQAEGNTTMDDVHDEGETS